MYITFCLLSRVMSVIALSKSLDTTNDTFPEISIREYSIYVKNASIADY